MNDDAPRTNAIERLPHGNVKAMRQLARELERENYKIRNELATLAAWKESALKEMPDYQRLGQLLDIPLGVQVNEHLIPAIEKLKARILTPQNASIMGKLAGLETIVSNWGQDIELVEAWLRKTHPELVTDSGMTAWGELTEKLAAETQN